ncbi:MAG: response regulator transcription factor [Anaerolineae bacterium]|nr:response regulator transcription factor [Anaerolineae bacterium]
MTTVLLIDDDAKLTEPISYELEQLGFHVVIASDGRIGLGLAMVEKPDAILLDIMLPGIDGWQVCQEIRRFSQVPIIMLTALGNQVDRVRGLELGADDYLTKPFSFQELVARLRAMLRRVHWDRNGEVDTEFRIGDVRIDNAAHRVYKGGAELVLRQKEYDLLLLLMQNNGKVVSRETLFNEIWGTDWLGDTRTLDVHVRWLRQKVELDASKPIYIQTVRGTGYRFATNEEVQT